VIDSEDASESKMEEESVNENVCMRNIKLTDCDLKEMNIIIW